MGWVGDAMGGWCGFDANAGEHYRSYNIFIWVIIPVFPLYGLHKGNTSAKLGRNYNLKTYFRVTKPLNYHPIPTHPTGTTVPPPSWDSPAGNGFVTIAAKVYFIKWLCDKIMKKKKSPSFVRPLLIFPGDSSFP